MFPYRRQGPKKRKGNGSRRGRGPQRPLPNSARELIPLLQPATKALAQVLAGRNGDSGQLAHAQALLSHAERLVMERQANRLNPAEREELFEQIARLKLTIADAEAEAEVEGVEDERPQEPTPTVDRARLREMALALASPKSVATEAPPPTLPTQVEAARDQANVVVDQTDQEPPSENELPSDEESGAQPKSEQNLRAGRLQLSVSGGEAAASAMTLRGPVRRRGGRPPARLKPVSSDERPASEGASEPEAAADDKPVEATTELHGHGPEPDDATNGHGDGVDRAEAGAEAKSPVKRLRRPRKGIPDGWVIDDEGFVVPGPV